jgi:hypothetical protein
VAVIGWASTNFNQMAKRYFDSETYNKLGQPDLGSKMYIIQNGKKVWGKVVSVHFTGEKSKHKGKIELGIAPFKPCR